MKSRQLWGWVLAVLAFPALALNTFAQDQDVSNAPNADPPARVARIQFISGEVSMQPGGVNDWVAAGLNHPLTTADRVWADKDSRVELNVGTGLIRLSSESSLTLTNVSDNTVQMQLDQGTLELTVRHLEPGEIFEVDTPNLAFTVMKSGVYRIDVPPNDNQTWVTVRKGSGEATGRGPAVKISSGSQVRFTGQGSLQNVAYSAPEPDGFDDWVQVRDKRLEGSESARYVAPGVIGAEDLDANGTWRVVPTYGAIWVPTTVQVGWAPYRFGRWVWVSPWGWTWVDNASWGFAPFHYGRWVFVGGFWGWSPGPVVVGWRPWYAPALVGWVGGSGWGIGVSFGFGWGSGCGWFPLGWGEPFYPGYRGGRGGFVSQTYIRNVNVTNTTINNITNVTNNYYNNTINNTHYVNRNVPGAVTAAPSSALANGQNIGRVGVAVPTSALGKGQIVRSADVTPTRQAVLGGHATTGSAVPPSGLSNRPVVTRNSPPVRQTNSAAEVKSGTPQAPATLSVHNPSDHSTAVAQGNTSSPASPASHNVPRPPDHHAATASTPAYQSQPPAQHTVPKPPYAGGPAPTATASAAHSGSSGIPATHTASAPHDGGHPAQPAASTNHGNSPGKSNQESKPKETSKSNPGMASVSVPRPPSGYTYRPAPAYTASTHGNSGSAYGGSRSYTPSTSPYAQSRSSYSPPAQSYHPAGGYSGAPTYTARASVPAAPHYSAPSSSGGGHSSGGGASHSSASGSHSSGHGR
jgi:hypothetical protein